MKVVLLIVVKQYRIFLTESPILDLKCGKLVGESELYLAILHPRSLSVCCINVDTTTTDTGIYYNINQIYNHKLQRTACNMCVGPFGFSKGKCLLHHFPLIAGKNLYGT